MKAKPVKLIYGEGYIECKKEDATHISLNIPCSSILLNLPVITKGTRKNTGCWTWNGSTEKPTLKPSVLTKSGDLFRSHSFITDGKVQFLHDCSHELSGKTVDLLDID